MCSTPYGITATIRAWLDDGAVQIPRRAQRLTASRQQSEKQLKNLANRVAFCAQRLTASRQQSDGDKNERSAPSHVLNALRHHGNNQMAIAAPGVVVRLLCSTPYGITATIRPGGFYTPIMIASAQRLTASRQQSGGRPAGGLFSILDVLNALRHHGNNQNLQPPISKPTPLRAQRLTASRQQSG